MYSFFYEYIRFIHLVKAFVLNAFSTERIKNKMDLFSAESIRFARTRLIFAGVIEFIGSIGPLAILVYGGYEIIQGNLTIGALMAFLEFVPYVFDSSLGLVSYFIDLEQVYPSIKNVFSVLDYEEENQKGAEFPALKKFDIVFDKVSFSLGDKKILKDVSFKIEENQMVSIVGKSGSGKSSTFKFIEGFWYPDKGRVLVGGQDTNTADIRSIRSAISYVTQETNMIRDTVYANIVLDKKISLEEVRRCAKIAQIDEIIEALSKKYDTVINPEETNFSGGQLQRVSLARALVQNKPIMLLDEFSAEIDPATEEKILDALAEFKGKKTIVIVTHDEPCVVNSDKVLVIDEGRLAEEGNYAKLCKTRSSFFNKVFRMRKQSQAK